MPFFRDLEQGVLVEVPDGHPSMARYEDSERFEVVEDEANEVDDEGGDAENGDA